MSQRVFHKPPNGDRVSVYYDRKGKPLPSYPDDERGQTRVVEQTTLGPEAANPGFLISTVYLVIEHGFDADSRPFIFETMVFASVRLGSEDTLWARYVSEEDARIGHAEAVHRYSDRVVDATVRLGGDARG